MPDNRQLQGECRAAAIGAPGVQFAAVLFDNFGTDAETKTETPLSIFGREERIEYTGHIASMDAAAVIPHGQVNAPILDKRLEVNRTRTLVRICNGVFCIDDQIQTNLLKTMRIATDILQNLIKS